MPSSILSSLFNTFDARSIGEIASSFGEPKQAVSQGLESSTACLLGGLANKASDSTWMSQLFKLVSDAPSNVSVSDLTGAITNPSRASSATSSLLDSGKRFLSRFRRQSVVDLRRSWEIHWFTIRWRIQLDEHGRATADDRSRTLGPRRSHELNGAE